MKDTGILVFNKKTVLEDYLVFKWMEIARRAISERGLFAAALSGGRTPAGFFRSLAGGRDESVWRNTHLFMVDERIVPHEDEASNWKMMDENLFSRCPVPRENIHPIPTGCRPEDCAQRYEMDLRTFSFFKAEAAEGGFPVFDLVHLGLGEDGHTASLFPGSPVLKEKSRLAAAVPDASRHDRVTLTYPVINSARNIIFLVMGEDKAGILARVAGKERDLPASAVFPQKGHLFFLADRGAASRLRPGSYESYVE
ncbi:MAG: 6-phosphogluconolactonase [Nitrospiraceae bacterium]|nr:6-phosphogluconolactonase [Nitrospiraceae bacterium]